MLAAAPQIATKLNRLIKQSAPIDDILELVQYDPGLTARILQVCNTPAYRGRNGVTSLHEGISRLGAQALSRIVWQVSMGSHLSGSLAIYGMSAGSLWRHSMITAIAAEELWKLSVFEEDIGAAFTAGLLHDVGKMLTNLALVGKEAAFRERIELDQLPAHEAETAVLGFNHADLSGLLLKKWGQVDLLVSAVAHHHNPERAANRRFATLLSVANECAHRHELGSRAKPNGDECPWRRQRLEALQISETALAQAMTAIQDRSQEVEILVAIM